MGRQNNTARSLNIISRAQGWDPDRIEGFEGVDLGEINHPREDIFKSDTWPIPAAAKDTSEPCPDPGVSTPPTFHTPELRENEDHSHAEPFTKYKPGAGRQ